MLYEYLFWSDNYWQLFYHFTPIDWSGYFQNQTKPTLSMPICSDFGCQSLIHNKFLCGICQKVWYVTSVVSASCDSGLRHPLFIWKASSEPRDLACTSRKATIPTKLTNIFPNYLLIEGKKLFSLHWFEAKYSLLIKVLYLIGWDGIGYMINGDVSTALETWDCIRELLRGGMFWVLHGVIHPKAPRKSGHNV